MNYVSAIEAKCDLIRERFSGLIGETICGYELAQMWCEDDQEWSDWMDIPLFLTINDKTLSISWQKFDELAIEWGRLLPFSVGGSTIRWLSEGVKMLDSILGETIVSVSLGRGQMSIEENEIKIWTRVLVALASGATLEIFNALDENGIEVHWAEIQGEIKTCV